MPKGRLGERIEPTASVGIVHLEDTERRIDHIGMSVLGTLVKVGENLLNHRVTCGLIRLVHLFVPFLVSLFVSIV